MSDWSSDQVLLFLEYYEGEPVIWDPRHASYKDKKKTGDAWKRLSEKLKLPIRDLKSKKEILMGTFRRHLKKKQQWLLSASDENDVYEPSWFAYQPMESFLSQVYTIKRSMNTETDKESMQIQETPDAEILVCMESDDQEDDGMDTLGLQDNGRASRGHSGSNNILHSMLTSRNKNHRQSRIRKDSSSSSRGQERIILPTLKPAPINQNGQMEYSNISQIMQEMQNITADEHTHFALSLVPLMRSLPSQVASEMRIRIYQMLHEVTHNTMFKEENPIL